MWVLRNDFYRFSICHGDQMYNLFFLSFSVQINVKIEALQLGLRSRSFPDIRRYAIQLELRVCVDFLLPNIQSSSSLLDRISAAAMKNVEQKPKKIKYQRRLSSL